MIKIFSAAAMISLGIYGARNPAYAAGADLMNVNQDAVRAILARSGLELAADESVPPVSKSLPACCDSPAKKNGAASVKTDQSPANPYTDQSINPDFNNLLNPNANPAINPGQNTSINPLYTHSLNPDYNQSLDPNYNQAINPDYNQSLNPVYNPSAVNQRIFSVGNTDCSGFMVKAGKSVYLIFTADTNRRMPAFDGVCVINAGGGCSRFDSRNAWIQYFVPHKKGGFLIFDLANHWTGWASPE